MTSLPHDYLPHQLHGPARSYRETNCYTDVLIELLHSQGLEPLAGLGHLVRTDFEGDQFSFFKIPQGDMERLYGVDIHEMQPVGRLPDQIELQLSLGRIMLVEMDSYFLPDTAATDYRRNHVKSSIAVCSIDQSAQSATYLHNTGMHLLFGEDYRGIFRLDSLPDACLPPYIELARFDAGSPLAGVELCSTSRDLLAAHLKLRPRSNPFAMFGERLTEDLPRLLNCKVEEFHAYAFATVRMAGAAFDLLGAHAEWLFGHPVAPALLDIVKGCQILSFRLARRRRFDFEPVLAELAASWDDAMSELERAVA
ncbi:MAG: DUF1839 family protein [Sphingomicrobium sp.]